MKLIQYRRCSECGATFLFFAPLFEIIFGKYTSAEFTSWQLEFEMHKLRCVEERVMGNITGGIKHET